MTNNWKQKVVWWANCDVPLWTQNKLNEWFIIRFDWTSNLFYDLMVLYISHYSYTVENTPPLIQYFNTKCTTIFSKAKTNSQSFIWRGGILGPQYIQQDDLWLTWSVSDGCDMTSLWCGDVITRLYHNWRSQQDDWHEGDNPLQDSVS